LDFSQILVHELNDHSAFADSRGYALHRTVAHVAHYENSWHIRFQQAGIALPHSSQALAAGGQPVSLSDIQPGDLVTYYSDASHVAIYIGDGMMVHASTYGTPVKVAPVGDAPIYDVRRY